MKTTFFCVIFNVESERYFPAVFRVFHHKGGDGTTCSIVEGKIFCIRLCYNLEGFPDFATAWGALAQRDTEIDIVSQLLTCTGSNGSIPDFIYIAEVLILNHDGVHSST